MRDLDQANVGTEETPIGLFTTLDQAMEAFDVAMKDVMEDTGVEDGDDIACDIALSIAHDCTPHVARELCRVELGFIPDALSFISPR